MNRHADVRNLQARMDAHHAAASRVRDAAQTNPDALAATLRRAGASGSSDSIRDLINEIRSLAASTPPPAPEERKKTDMKPLTTPPPTFDGKDKFEHFEDLFKTYLKMLPEDWTEEMRFHYFHTMLRKEALQTFKSIQRTPTTTLDDVLSVFRRKYVRPESQASAKHR